MSSTARAHGHAMMERATRSTPSQGVTEATASVEQTLRRGGGRPLDDGARGSFEPRFGHDFGQVRVHASPRAIKVSPSATGEPIVQREPLSTGDKMATDMSPDVSGSLGFSAWRDPAHANGGKAVSVSLPEFTATGTIIRDTSVPDDTYEMGFIQNLLSSTASSVYVDSDGNRFRKCEFSYPTPILDGKKDSKPWMRQDTVISVNSNDYIVKTNDKPNYYFVWDSTTDPSETTLDKNGQPGHLSSASGSEMFITWLALREKASKAITLRHWVTWNVDWACTFDYAAETGTSTGKGGSIGHQGKGDAITALVDGNVANDSLKITWGAA